MVTRYTRSGDVHIAYQVSGDGPDLLYVPTWVCAMEQLASDPQAWAAASAAATTAAADFSPTLFAERLVRFFTAS